MHLSSGPSTAAASAGSENPGSLDAGPEIEELARAQRAKCLKLGEFQSINTNASPPYSGGVLAASGSNGSNENGQGAGDGGSGKRKPPGEGDVIFGDPDSLEQPQNKTRPSDLPPPNPEEEAARAMIESDENSMLVQYAAKNDLEYIVPVGYEEKLDDFLGKWTPGRVRAIKELNDILEEDKRSIKYFQQNLRRARDQYKRQVNTARRSAQRNKIRENFKEKVANAFEENLGSLHYPRVVEDQIRELLMMRGEIVRRRFDEVIEEVVRVLCEQLLGIYRYKLEADKETYRSRSFTATSFAQVTGHESVYEALYKPSGELKTIVDFGCGDGETLFQLAQGCKSAKREMKRQERRTREEEIRPLIMEEVYEEFKMKNLGDFPWTTMDREVRTRVLQILSNEIKIENKHQEEEIKPKFIGIDQASAFVTRLNEEKGLTGRDGDICSSRHEFVTETQIMPKSADIAITILTVDRAKSKKNLFANIAGSLVEGGLAVIAMHPEYDAKSDPSGEKDEFILYGDYDEEDWDLSGQNITVFLDKLLPQLKKTGLKPVRLARHQCRVISVDCEIEGKRRGPQSYNMVVVVCKKESPQEEMPVNATEDTPVDDPGDKPAGDTKDQD